MREWPAGCEIVSETNWVIESRFCPAIRLYVYNLGDAWTLAYLHQLVCELVSGIHQLSSSQSDSSGANRYAAEMSHSRLYDTVMPATPQDYRLLNAFSYKVLLTSHPMAAQHVPTCDTSSGPSACYLAQGPGMTWNVCRKPVVRTVAEI